MSNYTITIAIHVTPYTFGTSNKSMGLHVCINGTVPCKQVWDNILSNKELFNLHCRLSPYGFIAAE